MFCEPSKGREGEIVGELRVPIRLKLAREEDLSAGTGVNLNKEDASGAGGRRRASFARAIPVDAMLNEDTP